MRSKDVLGRCAWRYRVPERSVGEGIHLGDNLYVRGYSGTPPVAVTGAGYTLLDRQFLKGFVRLDVVPVGDLGEVVAPLIGVAGSSPIAPTN
jgi:hypothetical protein